MDLSLENRPRAGAVSPVLKVQVAELAVLLSAAAKSVAPVLVLLLPVLELRLPQEDLVARVRRSGPSPRLPCGGLGLALWLLWRKRSFLSLDGHGSEREQAAIQQDADE